MTPFFWLLTLLGIFLGAFGGILLKQGSVELQHQGSLVQIVLHAALNWKIVGAVVLYFVPFLIWVFLLKRVDISFLQPIFSLTYVITPALATLLLHEQVPLLRWMGVAIIILGVVIVARS